LNQKVRVCKPLASTAVPAGFRLAPRPIPSLPLARTPSVKTDRLVSFAPEVPSFITARPDPLKAKPNQFPPRLLVRVPSSKLSDKTQELPGVGVAVGPEGVGVAVRGMVGEAWGVEPPPQKDWSKSQVEVTAKLTSPVSVRGAPKVTSGWAGQFE